MEMPYYGYNLTFGKSVKINSEKHPDKIAIYFEGHNVTYKELNERANRLSNAMQKLGFQKGDTVSVLLYNGIECVVTWFGLAKAGICFVPVNYRLEASEIAYIISNSDSKAVILGAEFVEKVASIRGKLAKSAQGRLLVIGSPVPEGMMDFDSLLANASGDEPNVEVKLSDWFHISYTSGTTGRPKGAVISHRPRVFQALLSAFLFKIYDGIHLAAGPLYHSGPFGYAIIQLYYGGSIVIMKNFVPEEVPKIIEQYRITNTWLVPTMLTWILNVENRKNYDVSSMTSIVTAGSALSPRTKEELQGYFRNAQVYEYYGLTEFGITAALKTGQGVGKYRTVGMPVFGVELKLLDDKGNEVSTGEVGEIYTRGPYLFDGYYNMSEETAKCFRGDWFGSGDMGRVDEDGFLYIVDRKHDMVISGGVNIYPAEIDEALYSHPGVLEAAVVGVPDEKWGEALKGFVVIKKGFSMTEDELKQFLKGKIAGYKVPKSFAFVEELPKTSSGKILKRELRRPFWEGREFQVE